MKPILACAFCAHVLRDFANYTAMALVVFQDVPKLRHVTIDRFPTEANLFLL